MAGLLAALALSSALEVHPAGEPLGPAGHRRLTLSVPETGHPVTSTHVEASFALEVPPCPACLLRTQTSGVPLLAAARLTAPPLVERIAAAAPHVPEGRSSLPRSSRAPPLA